MKILVSTLFIYFSIFVCSFVLAGDKTLIANYPAPSGSYNKVVLQNLPTTTNICSNSPGLLFMDIATNTLQLCTADGTQLPVPYPETCFNRFCSSPGPVACTNFTSPDNTSCPTGYAVANFGASKFDMFNPDASTTVYSIVCCTGTKVTPT